MTWVYDPDQNWPITPKKARTKFQKAMLDLLAGKNPGPQSFRLKPTKKASETYPLKLTQQQRETLLEHTQLSGKLKKKIEQADGGTQVIPVTWNELHKLNDETGQAAVYARSPHKKRLIAVMGKVVKFFEEEHKEVFGIEEPAPRKSRLAKSGLLYQFKTTLLGSKPPIWRRIQVQDCTLDKLHEHIQTSMGWENSHLHQFDIGGHRYGDPQLLDDGFDDFDCVDSTKTLLSVILPKTGERFAFKYEYDFGDDWEHEVLFEGTLPVDPKAKYPLCLEGERPCPPEDCGGIWGYYDMLEALADPKHEQHDEFMEWIGPIDADRFDAVKATKEMKKGLPDWRD